uniref:EGF-like domain-containing protein n=2 Tax=Clytia hemisphaerica TaxID=252671 RepID=A0A7M5XDH2_9CNID
MDGYAINLVMYIQSIIIFLSLQQYTVYGAIKTSVSNTTVGSTQYIVKKTMFKKYPNLMPASTANNYQSINQEITNATTKKCGTFCYQENDCWSFLFFRSKTPPTCTLLDGPIDRTHMDQNITVDYHEVWNQCSSNDSICNLGVCVPNYVTDSYTCHCPSTYTGQHCQTLISQSDATTTSQPNAQATEQLGTEYTCSNNPIVIDTYAARTTTWKVEVTFTFETLVKGVTFFEMKYYNGNLNKFFALQLRTPAKKLRMGDLNENKFFDFELTTKGYFIPTTNTFYKIVIHFEPSLTAPSSFHYQLKDGTETSLSEGTFPMSVGGDLGELRLYNG